VPAGPSARASLVWDIVNQVSQGQYRTYQVDIQDMGLGLYGGPAFDQGYRNRDGWLGGGTLGNREARLYLADQFSAMGLDVYVQGGYSNVVAELPGTSTPERVYVVCGHFDTTSGGERPGGDDNASGTAGVVEAARVLTQYRFNSTLRFIGFNAEEDWMKGSQNYVDTVVVPNNEDIAGVINLDMILRPGFDSAPHEPPDVDIETGDAPLFFDWVDIFVEAAATYAPNLVIDPTSPTTEYWYASDQGPFIGAGYPALLAIENTADEVWGGSNRYYHRAGDASDAPANDPFSPSGVTYDYGFAADIVRATVATIAQEAEIVVRSSPSFEVYQTLPVHEANDLEFFSIADANYLVVANSRDEMTYDVNSTVYRWDGERFVDYQHLATSGAADWEFFTIDGEHFLAVANMRNDTTHQVNSQILRWDGSAFVDHQSIATSGARDWAFFTIDGIPYLAVANSFDDTTHEIDSQIYRWDGEAFVAFQSLPTAGAADCEFFTIDGDAYLAIANAFDGSTYEVESSIYQWDGTTFVPVQSAPGTGASDWEFFSIGDEAFLVLANRTDGTPDPVDSALYRWDGTDFAFLQSIPTYGATDWEAFAVEGEPHLVVANEAGSQADNTTSKVYTWNGTRLVEFLPLSADGATSWASFALTDANYLAVAGTSNEAGPTGQVTVYRFQESSWTPPPVSSTTPPR
jgi:hypothetical protein